MRYIKLSILFLLISFSSAAVAQIKVACVGNSVTYGYKLDDPKTESYPSQLQEMLGDGYEVGNFGRSGATLLFNGHNPYVKTQEFVEAKKFEADIVVIHLGLNDTDPRNWPTYKDEFAMDYSNLIDSLTQHNSDCRVIIARMSPIFDRHARFESSTRDWYYEVQREIENVAKYRGVELIDFQELLQSYPTMMPDALHPDKEGAGLLAKRVYSAVTGDFGGLQMPITYSDNMILQRGESLKIRGVANANQSVKVTLGSKVLQTRVGYDGDWIVEFKNVEASSKAQKLKIETETQSLEFDNVLIGDVWLASGQSNMAYFLRNTQGGNETAAQADCEQIRLFNMTNRNNDATEWDLATLDSMNHLKGYNILPWESASSSSVADFSAVAYYFAKNLQDSLQIPIGIISNSIGGTTAESWIDRGSLEREIPAIFRNWPNNDFTEGWVNRTVNTNLANKITPQQRHYYEPAFMYETGIMPLEQFDIKGVIWYQGESNAHNIASYARLFRMLVESWRENWENPELPFYFVQLSSIATRGSWPEFRDTQRLLNIEIPHTAMAVCSDIGDTTDVHPRNKKDVGYRLALLALSDSYDKRYLRSEGAINPQAVLCGKSVEISFDSCSSLSTSDGEQLANFEVAEVDGFFVEAEARIEGNRVILSGYGDITPTLVRYGWQPYSLGNLVNEAGLPSSTFKVEIKTKK